MPTEPIARLQIHRLDPRATIPAYHSDRAAGLDLAVCLPRGDWTGDSLELRPGQIVKAPTGLAIALPAGHEGQVRPRSGLATRYGVTVVNAPGTIDEDYRGEVMIALINLGPEPVTLSHGDRVAQLIVAPVARVEVVETERLDATRRGTGGFGSSGRQSSQ